jgi:RNA polymerase sigma factor (sigma-70 family)
VEQRDERLDLRQALEHFARAYPNKARVVQLRFFAGLSVEDTAARLGLSPGGVRRQWYEARAWLADYLGALPSGPEARPQAEGVPPAAARA